VHRYGTAKFLGLFGLQLTLWLIYAVVLVADAVVLVDKALRDLDSAPEIWVRPSASRRNRTWLKQAAAYRTA
jgi:hypothetical protein